MSSGGSGPRCLASRSGAGAGAAVHSGAVRARCRRGGLALGVVAVAAAVAVVGSVPASATIAFGPAEHFPTGSSFGPGPGATTTLALDVDGDGDVDVVTTDWFGDGPLVLRNTGTGGYGAPEPIAGAGDIGALAAGDVDGDGRSDLVGRDAEGVVVLLAAGDGTFVPGDRLPVSANAQQSIALVDANGDERLDVVTPERLGIRVLFGHGDGTFELGPSSPLAGLLADLKPADLDGDAVPDVVVADATPLTQRVVALRGNGDGTFAESGSGRVGYGPEAVMAGDLDGDGVDDAVSVDSFSVFGQPPSFSITVLLADGHGAFGAPATYPTGDGPVSGALADFDGDGALDVAVSAVGSSVVAVYAGDGAGGLTEVGRFPVVRQPQTPAAADVDGDGWVDIVVLGVGQLSVLRNTMGADGAGGAGATTTTSTSPAPAAAPSGASPAGALPSTGPAWPVWVPVTLLGVGLILLRRRGGTVSHHGNEW